MHWVTEKWQDMIVNQRGEALYWSQNSSMGYSLQKNRWTHPFCDGKYSLTQEKSHRFESKNQPLQSWESVHLPITFFKTPKSGTLFTEYFLFIDKRM